MTTPPTTIRATSKLPVTTPAGAPLAVLGDADTLATAYQQGTPVTLDGKNAGEQVYLGHTHQTYDDGITVETIGHVHTLGESPRYPSHTIAAYLIDMTRLDDAPTLKAAYASAQARATRAAAAVSERVARDDDRLDDLQED